MAVIPEHEVPDEALERAAQIVDEEPEWGRDHRLVASLLARASLDAYRAANPPTPEVGSWWRYDGYDLCRVSAVDPDGTVLVRWWAATRLTGADSCAPEEWADDDQRFVPSSPPAGWEETP